MITTIQDLKNAIEPFDGNLKVKVNHTGNLVQVQPPPSTNGVVNLVVILTGTDPKT